MSTKDLAKIIIPIGIAVIVIVIIIVAIYFPPTGTLECSLQSAPGDPHADYTYRIKFNFWKVKQMEAEEISLSFSLCIRWI